MTFDLIQLSFKVTNNGKKGCNHLTLSSPGIVVWCSKIVVKAKDKIVDHILSITNSVYNDTTLSEYLYQLYISIRREKLNPWTFYLKGNRNRFNTDNAT